MDSDKANIIKDLTQTKTVRVLGMNDNKQMSIIEKLEEVLNFLKSGQIKNEEDLDVIKKPIDDLQSSLKFIPNGKHFSILPTEIKMNIMSYLCNSNAFTAASVCQEWKVMLGSRFVEEMSTEEEVDNEEIDTEEVDEEEKITVIIGKRSCDKYACNLSKDCAKGSNPLSQEVMLKASADHKLNVHLEIRHDVTKVDPKVVTEGLLSVSSFSLSGARHKCTCDNGENLEIDLNSCECEINTLSFDQLGDLFKGIEKRETVLEKVELFWLDMTKIDQDRLVHCLVNKIENLTLQESDYGKMLNFEKLIRKLSEQATEFKLNHLTLYKFEYPDELAIDLADALCNVQHVMINFNLTLKLETMKQIINNIITRPVKLKSLIMSNSKYFDFSTLINPEDLKLLLNKMIGLRLEGTFTSEQIEAAKSLPDVEVGGRVITVIMKGC